MNKVVFFSIKHSWPAGGLADKRRFDDKPNEVVFFCIKKRWPAGGSVEGLTL